MSTSTHHLQVRPDWLETRKEAAIDPQRPILDAHHHLWDHANNPYLADAFLKDADAGHNIVASVFVECHMHYDTTAEESFRSVGETAWATEVSRSAGLDGTRVAAGIVGYVDLMAGAGAAGVLERHIEVSGGRFCSVRNTSAWHGDPSARGSIATPPPDLLYRDDFRAGLAELSRLGLAFDAWMYHTQLDELSDLMDAFPDTIFVLNHCGGPIGIGPYAGKRQEVFEDWREKMRRVAERPNIYVKLGGFGMRLFGFDVHTKDLPPSSEDLARLWGPYAETAIALFGPQRCMFESNFPVDKGSCDYVTLWNAYKRIAAQYSASEQQDLFMDAALRAYGPSL